MNPETLIALSKLDGGIDAALAMLQAGEKIETVSAHLHEAQQQMFDLRNSLKL